MQVCELHWPGSGESSEALGIHFPTNSEAKINWVWWCLGICRTYHVLQKPVIFSNLEGRPNMPFQFGWFPMVRNSFSGEVWRFTSLTLPKKSSKIPRLFTGYGFHFEFMGCFYDILPSFFVNQKKIINQTYRRLFLFDRNQMRWAHLWGRKHKHKLLTFFQVCCNIHFFPATTPLWALVRPYQAAFLSFASASFTSPELLQN